jgi:hypothetical protein
MYIFKSEPSNIQLNIITGCHRSGKTLIGDILGSCKSVEFFEEPVSFRVLPFIYKENNSRIEFLRTTAETILSGMVKESIAMRSVNYKLNEPSRIWTKKTLFEIFYRFLFISDTNSILKYLKNNNINTIMTLADEMPFLSFWSQMFPNCRYVYVVRNGFDVAEDIAKKGWFSNEQLNRPIGPYCYRKSLNTKDLYIPWWVTNDLEDLFLGCNQYERGLLYWLNMNNLQHININKDKYLIIRYDEIVNNIVITTEKVANFLNLELSNITKLRLKFFRKKRRIITNKDCNNLLRLEVETINNKLGV